MRESDLSCRGCGSRGRPRTTATCNVVWRRATPPTRTRPMSSRTPRATGARLPQEHTQPRTVRQRSTQRSTAATQPRPQPTQCSQFSSQCGHVATGKLLVVGLTLLGRGGAVWVSNSLFWRGKLYERSAWRRAGGISRPHLRSFRQTSETRPDREHTTRPAAFLKFFFVSGKIKFPSMKN